MLDLAGKRRGEDGNPQSITRITLPDKIHWLRRFTYRNIWTENLLECLPPRPRVQASILVDYDGYGQTQNEIQGKGSFLLSLALFLHCDRDM